MHIVENGVSVHVHVLKRVTIMDGLYIVSDRVNSWGGISLHDYTYEVKDNCIAFTRDAICVVLSVDVYKPIRNYNPPSCVAQAVFQWYLHIWKFQFENSKKKLFRRCGFEWCGSLDILIKGIFKISIVERYWYFIMVFFFLDFVL